MLKSPLFIIFFLLIMQFTHANDVSSDAKIKSITTGDSYDFETLYLNGSTYDETDYGHYKIVRKDGELSVVDNSVFPYTNKVDETLIVQYYQALCRSDAYGMFFLVSLIPNFILGITSIACYIPGITLMAIAANYYPNDIWIAGGKYLGQIGIVLIGVASGLLAIPLLCLLGLGIIWGYDNALEKRILKILNKRVSFNLNHRMKVRFMLVAGWN